MLRGLQLIGVCLTLWVLVMENEVQAQAVQQKTTIGEVIRHDPRLDELIAPDAQIEVLAHGFEWTEGPIWVPRGEGYLLFSDIPRNSIYKWEEGQGLSLFMKPSGYTGEEIWEPEPGTNGLTLDAQGRLVMCEHGNRRITRLIREKDCVKQTLADRYQGKRLNSPNDLVYRSNGDLYFTDPPYGLPKRHEDPRLELDHFGVYRLTPDGELTLLTAEMSRPNGLAFSPDEKTLYVSQSDPAAAVWMAYEVQADGTLGKGRVFKDVTDQVGQGPGLPDGMKVDVHGNLFATGPGGIHIYTPQGELLGKIVTGEKTANCTFGGKNHDVLYITADMYICRIQTKTKGAAR